MSCVENADGTRIVRSQVRRCLAGAEVELPVEDAAQIVQSSPQVVRRRMHRARLMLRGFLERLWSV